MFVKLKNELKQLFIAVLAISLIYQVGRTFFLEQEHDIRDGAYELVQLLCPDAFSKAYDNYGLFRFNPDQAPMQRCTGVVPKNSVILIHGLDEPGFIFSALASALYNKGYGVLFFFYPNDQRIDASSRFLFSHLSSLDFDGPVVLVTHSMGGIVARQMLVDPGIDYKGALAKDKVPQVSDLIMVGTPNHGAFLARFRLFMEIREQILLATHGRWHGLSAFTDGTGAAGIDLLPQSDFMKQLNSQPFPQGIQFHVIAGQILPFPANMPKQFKLSGSQTIADLLPPPKNYLASLPDKAGLLLGDGLVSINSAVPLDVPVTLVRANHKTLLDNLFPADESTPPAIPVILDILENR